MYISRHAVERFRERILHEHSTLTDADIRHIIHGTTTGPMLAAIATPLDHSRPAAWRYFHIGNYMTRTFYVLVPASGDGAVTVLSELQFGRWKLHGMFRRERGRRRPAPVLTEWTWRAIRA